MKKDTNIKTIFLDDLYKWKVNYFIDLKNIYRVSYHKFQGDNYLCSKTKYDYTDICPECDCLFCHQKINKQDVIYADILIINRDYQIDTNKILLLSQGEYQLLLRQNKYLFLNDSLDLDKVYWLLHHLKDNKRVQVKKIKSYESWVKMIMNLTKSYGK